eukprot:364469-Chlamydomonas_euryale.AAC.14
MRKEDGLQARQRSPFVPYRTQVQEYRTTEAGDPSIQSNQSWTAGVHKPCRSARSSAAYGQFTCGFNASMTGIVAARCDPATTQWTVMRVGMPTKMTE